MGNRSFVFGGEELGKTVKVFLWTVASALVVLLTDAVGMIELPPESGYAFLIPIANTVLYALKEFIADNRI